jgi:integrase
MPPTPKFGASVRARPLRNGVSYDVRYRLNGSQCTQTFTSDRAAQKWANVVRAIGPTDAIALLGVNTHDQAPTVDEYANRYILTKSGVEGKTTDDYRSFMRIHISPTLGALPIDAIGADAITAWINTQSASGAASKSIKNRHGFLAAMFQSAVDDGLIVKNPCARSRLPESERLEMTFLSPDEFTHLLAYVPVKYQPLVLFLATTGLRWGEATALRPADFDLEARTVRVSRAWKHSSEKGNYIGPPKTKRSRRTVSLPDDVCATLRPLIDAGHEYVFTNAQGNPVRQQKFWESVWNPARRMANGLPAFAVSRGTVDRPWLARVNGVWDTRQPSSKPLGKSPRIHDLRHSHASWLLAGGVPLPTIQRRLGHESITTTIDLYSHLSPDMQTAPADVMGHMLAGAMPQLTKK